MRDWADYSKWEHGRNDMESPKKLPPLLDNVDSLTSKDVA